MPRAAPESGHPLQGLNMKPNEGTLDRTLRVSAGLILIVATASGAIGLWGYVGVVPLVTGMIGLCPLYSLLGISTCPAPAAGPGKDQGGD